MLAMTKKGCDLSTDIVVVSNDLVHLPVPINPQANHRQVRVLAAKEADRTTDMVELIVIRGWIPGTICMAKNGYPDRTMSFD